MPSLEMRRSTRVFVPKTKDGEVVRVLRSGRRLWVESGTGKLKGGRDGDDWFPLIKGGSNGTDPARGKETGWVGHGDVGPGQGTDSMDVDDDVKGVARSGNGFPVSIGEGVEGVEWRYKSFYKRKRKRRATSNGVVLLEPDSGKGEEEDKRFGLCFVRKKRSRRYGDSVCSFKKCKFDRGIVNEEEIHGFGDDRSLSIVVEPSCGQDGRSSRLLFSVLWYMTGNVSMMQLSDFLLCDPIRGAFGSCGIHFTMNRPYSNGPGICTIFSARQSMLMFSVDFSAVPMSFLHLHTSVWLRCARWFCVLAICSPNKRKRNQSKIDIDETSPCINGPAEQCPSSSMTTETNECNEVKLVHRLCVLALPSEYRRKKTRCRTGTDEPITVIKNQGERGKDACGDIKMADYSFATPKASSRNGQYRNGVMFRSGQKRRRRSMSTRRARNPASFAVLRASGAVISDHITARKTAASFYSVRSNQELRRSLRKSTSTDTSVPKLSSLSLPEDIDSVKCAVNILVVEPDRCYRVIGAEITLEISASNEWVLLVKKEGSTRYCIKAQSEIKPKTTNRFTHAAIWTGDNGWKLEFPVRKDWLVFKELYKVCGERNVVPTSPIVKIIPVPGAYEVSCPRDATRAPFVRPESYIKMGDTELSRALSRTTANYDMDSEDEEWLDEFNGEKGAESEALHGVSEEMFELMIDAFEKALYYSPENYDDEKPGADQCIDLASREVVEAVYSYWMKKRKQKRAPLLKVFQLNEPRRAQLIPKPILRKKRSLKRQSLQSIHFGRGKDRNALQAIAEDRNPAEEQTETLRVEEAKASATRTVEEAIKKRQRAQFLMENADMAVYRATMALRIAEAAAAAQVGESNDADAASHFLDWEEREKGSKPG